MSRIPTRNPELVWRDEPEEKERILKAMAKGSPEDASDSGWVIIVDGGVIHQLNLLAGEIWLLCDGERGVAQAEVIGTGEVPDALADRQLLVELVKGGRVVAREPLDAARDRHAAVRAALPLSAVQLSRGEPVLPTEYV